jgi:protein-disulfide isomerase
VISKTLIFSCLALALFAASSYGAFRYGETEGQRAGYQWGLKKGRVEAARQGPPQVRDVAIPLAVIKQTSAWQKLPEDLSSGEFSALVTLVNAAPSPCPTEARKGISLATSLLDPDSRCAGLADQLGLARAALRSVGPDEALAVLRVERRLQPDVAGRPSRGSAEAKVVLTEWGDFECPYCVRSQGMIDEVLEAREDVRVVFKHLPLSFHKAAMPAALAAEAAAEQGLFWEMHDALFAMGKGLSDGIPGAIDSDSGPVAFEQQARTIGLDLERYRKDYRSERVYERVRGDAKEARRLGVNGTPSFFLDGRRVTERLSVKNIGLAVDKALAEQAGHFSWDLRAPKGLKDEPPPPEPKP